MSSAAEFITTSAANALAVYLPWPAARSVPTPDRRSLVEHYAEQLVLLIGRLAASPS